MNIIPVSKAARIMISAGALLAATNLPSAAVDLAAHHATYVLSLAPGNGGGATGADGIMTYDFKDTCDGWATDVKLKIIITDENGGPHTAEVSQVYWEARNGKAFRFMTKISGGGSDDQSSQTRGEVRIDSSGKATVTADLPAQAEAKLPDETVFPAAQTEQMLQKAAAGETFASATLFDGTIPTEAAQVTALIGDGVKDWKGPKAFPDLAGHVSYPVGLAYFIGNKTDSTPDSEQSLRIYDNGIVGIYDFDFVGGIKIRATLDGLQLLSSPTC
jgi:hypothetical protein